MSCSLALTLVAAATAAPMAKVPQGMRLLQFGENETRWVPVEQIDNLT